MIGDPCSHAGHTINPPPGMIRNPDTLLLTRIYLATIRPFAYFSISFVYRKAFANGIQIWQFSQKIEKSQGRSYFPGKRESWPEVSGFRPKP
jgi:hypothetical protein